MQMWLFTLACIKLAKVIQSLVAKDPQLHKYAVDLGEESRPKNT